ncbi:MAG: thioredoxin domain-containing protein [Lacisediminihabitans sp.]
MPNRLATAVSPYLRSHADNPVDWQQWGREPFEEAARRGVPVLVSIGYSTCHWCHVMARESFSDPVLAAYLNDNFVAIKVDREEYPDVDSSYLAAAGAFTGSLGWPLNVFVTPQGRAFFAGTYWPPEAMAGHPAFRQVLEAVVEAWTGRRSEVEDNAARVAEALAAQGHPAAGILPDENVFARIVRELIDYEDGEFGGFGGAPKFPVAPVLLFLLERGSLGDADALALAERTLVSMARSDLRDPLEGGFFRYSTRRDWTEPHYERMLYDNAQLLTAYTRLAQLVPDRREFAEGVARGVVGFLSAVMRLPSGAFASAQDSESTVDGHRVEGGYYKLDVAARARQVAPARDEKVLSGWNGLAIEALASAGFVFDRADWIDAARVAADYLIAHHLKRDGTLLRASVGESFSLAAARLDDYGMLARGLLELTTVTGGPRYATIARQLVDGSMSVPGARPFAVPGGPDPVLAGHGLALEVDPAEGAYPSGLSTMASAAHQLSLLTAEAKYRVASSRAMELFAPLAIARPVSFGAALAVMSALAAPASQLVVVSDDSGSPLASVARAWHRSGGMASVVTATQAQELAAAGFELFEGRSVQDGGPTAYLCRDFVCRLPLTDAAAVSEQLSAP